MSSGNINITKETGPDKNLPEWPAKHYGAGQQLGATRPPLLAMLPWQSLIVLGVFLLACALLIWRWRVVWCYDNPSACAAQSDQLWGVLLPVLVFVGSLAGILYVCARLWAAYQGARAESLQRRIVFDRFDNPVDVEVFTEPGLQARMKAAVQALQVASELEQAIAQWKRLSGVNVYTEGSNSSVATTLDLPPKAELLATPMGVPSSEWLRWIDETPHLMIAGRTNAGKTTLASAILAERIQAGDDILVIDPHDQPDKWFGAQAIGGGRRYEDILTTLDTVVREMDTRYQAYNEGTPTTAFPRLTVLVDEVPAIMDACLNEHRRIIDGRWSQFARKLGSEARKVRISVILLTQSILVQDIGVNTAMRKNFSRIGLGDEVRKLLTEERDTDRRAELEGFVRGQAHPAVMEYLSEIHVLDTTGIPDLAARDVAHLVKAWRPSVHTNPPTPPVAYTNGRTDGGRTYTQDRIRLYLEALARQGKSREFARQWAQARGLRFENSLWTDVLEGVRQPTGN